MNKVLSLSTVVICLCVGFSMATEKPLKPLFPLKPDLMPGDSIDLSWCPKDSIDGQLVLPVRECKFGVAIDSVTDARENKDYLGKNINGKTEKKVNLKSGLSLWVKTRLNSCLAAKCSTIVREDRYSVNIKIDRFDITESNVYRCSFEVHIEIIGQDSVPVEKQKISGASEYWGKSFNGKSFSAASGNAIIQIANAILAFDTFKKYQKSK
jgi:hypothetical protein